MSKVWLTVLESIIATIVGGILYAIWGFLWTIPLKYAWNYVMPYLFGFPTITYWRMFLLYFLLTSLWKLTITTVRYKE